MSVSGNVVAEYCRKHPTASTRTLASMLWKRERKLFANFDQARDAVRYRRGQKASGGSKAKQPAAYVPLEIPASDAKPVEPVLFDSIGRGVILADLHFPYHDADAIQIAIRHAVESGHTDYCILLGDALDCYQLSRFEKDPRNRDFAGELQMFGRFLDALLPRFKTVWYKLGNHEVRYERYLLSKAPELLDLPALTDLPTLLDYDQDGQRLNRPIRYVKASQLIYAGALTLLHGHEFGSGISSPVNPARGMYLKATACTVSAHEHKSSNHNDSNIRGVLSGCWSLGCLCERHPPYRPVNKWNHGFALMSFDGHDFGIDNKRIIDGKVF